MSVAIRSLPALATTVKWVDFHCETQQLVIIPFEIFELHLQRIDIGINKTLEDQKSLIMLAGNGEPFELESESISPQTLAEWA